MTSTAPARQLVNRTGSRLSAKWRSPRDVRMAVRRHHPGSVERLGERGSSYGFPTLYRQVRIRCERAGFVPRPAPSLRDVERRAPRELAPQNRSVVRRAVSYAASSTATGPRPGCDPQPGAPRRHAPKAHPVVLERATASVTSRAPLPGRRRTGRLRSHPGVPRVDREAHEADEADARGPPCEGLLRASAPRASAYRVRRTDSQPRARRAGPRRATQEP